MSADLVNTISQQLLRSRWMLGIAESCTGGNISKSITDKPGASAYFLGSIVSYANEVKTDVLGVQPETLAAFGAVSEQTAREMAVGARRVLKADVGLSITGIAGPDGGTEDKPVGTIWLAIATAKGVSAKHLLLSGDRHAIREAATAEALSFLDEMIAS